MIKSHRSIIPYSAAAIIVILISVFAAFLTPFDPYAQNLDKALMPPNVENLLGTDRYGRDLLSRIIMGSQTTVLGALSVILRFLSSALLWEARRDLKAANWILS